MGRGRFGIGPMMPVPAPRALQQMELEGASMQEHWTARNVQTNKSLWQMHPSQTAQQQTLPLLLGAALLRSAVFLPSTPLMSSTRCVC